MPNISGRSLRRSLGLGWRLAKGIVRALIFVRAEKIQTQIARVKNESLLEKLSWNLEDDLMFGANELEHVEFWAEKLQQAAPDCPTGWVVMAEAMISNQRKADALVLSGQAFEKWLKLPKSLRGMFAERTIGCRCHALALNGDMDSAVNLANKYGSEQLKETVWQAAYPLPVT